VLRPSIGDVRSTSIITAIVRDGSGQPVIGKTVVFYLEEGPGGGETISPGTAVTDATGTASVEFISGGMTSAQEGVQIRAIVQADSGLPNENVFYADTYVTIGNTATSIVIGTTNVISEEFAGDPPLAIGYALPISILVVDSNSNPIPNATVNLGAYTLTFSTGYERDPLDTKIYDEDGNYLKEGVDGPDPVYTGTFTNEDLNRNGFLDPGEDRNGNGRLDPGSVASLPLKVVTDNDGLAAFELKYAKGFGNWATVEIIASTQVYGDLTTAKLVVPLAVLAGDVPYMNSPFGIDPSIY